MAEASPTVLGGAVISREAAFELLVQTELPQAYRTATLVLGDATEAEDAVQEAMVRAWQRIAQLRDPARAGAWFGRLLMNVCRDRLRTRRSSPIAWLEPPAGRPPDDFENREAVLRALAALPAEQRIAVVLRYYLDLSLVEIADRTRAPLGTVKTRLHYGLQAMRASYEANDRGGEVRDD